MVINNKTTKNQNTCFAETRRAKISSEISNLQSMQKQVKKLTVRLWAGIFLLFIILAAGIFVFANFYYEQLAQAFTQKSTGDQLTANDWNALTADFVNKAGDTMSGNLTVSGDVSVNNLNTSGDVNTGGHMNVGGNLTANNVCNTAGDCLGNFVLWESQGYGYIYSDATGSNTVNLGTHTFCALSKVQHDGGNGGYCNISVSGSSWSLTYGKWGGGGINCTVMCF